MYVLTLDSIHQGCCIEYAPLSLFIRNTGLHKVKFRTWSIFLWPLNMLKVIANIWNSKGMILFCEGISL